MASPGKSLALFTGEAHQPALPRTPVPGAFPHFRGRPDLWLAIYLPRFPLENWGRSRPPTPLAVVEGHGAGRCVLVCDDRAAALGIRPGVPLSAAFALAPELYTLERNLRREREALEHLAGWAGQFSPLISLEPPAALLLEARGSLRLFGGVEGLRRKVHTGLGELGYSACLAYAPTPLASLWLARAGNRAVVTEAHALPGRLGQLPLDCLAWPEDLIRTLYGMGVRRLRDCLRLPRDGFARRVGRTRLTELDRALGRLPDPRAAHQPPERFRATRELPAETDTTAFLLDAARRLIAELSGFLRARRGGIQTLELILCHAGVPATRLQLALLGPSRDPRHLLTLLAERLERTQLPAPAIALELRSGEVEPFEPPGENLFGKQCPDRGRQQSGIPKQLVERLRARMGTDAVYGLCLVPEHRPEAAWRSVDPGRERAKIGSRSKFSKEFTPTPAFRPMWILPEPRLLGVDRGRPSYQGRLKIHSDPERIETGWWDGHDVARDYYVARHPEGMRLWIFRERVGERRWFLHGIFG